MCSTYGDGKLCLCGSKPCSDMNFCAEGDCNSCKSGFCSIGSDHCNLIKIGGVNRVRCLCGNEEKCDDGYKCQNGKCVCNSDDVCDDNFTCEDGECVCSNSLACTNENSCIDGKCVCGSEIGCSGNDLCSEFDGGTCVECLPGEGVSTQALCQCATNFNENGCDQQMADSCGDDGCMCASYDACTNNNQCVDGACMCGSESGCSGNDLCYWDDGVCLSCLEGEVVAKVRI